jgi:hypothetical protein
MIWTRKKFKYVAKSQQSQLKDEKWGSHTANTGTYKTMEEQNTVAFVLLTIRDLASGCAWIHVNTPPSLLFY